MSETQNNPGFNGLGIPPSIEQKIARLGFTVPTPIQAKAIPLALDRRDIIGVAQTGTGKTLAFAVPMIANLRNIQMGLVLAPTRELALQIEEVYRQLGVKTAVLIGGAPMGRQVAQLRGRPAVIVATPGRLLDHLEQRTLSLRLAAVVVLDEADRMLDMGFAPAIRRILDLTPRDRQTMLFSATIPAEIAELAQTYLQSPVRIEINPSGTVADHVEQELFVVEREDKAALLGDVLRAHKGTALVFTRTRHGARKLATTVRAHGHATAELHSDRTMAQRTAALHDFKSGGVRVLIATDIAARGIDVKEIGLIVNYDIPENPEDYVHRIGRTGRAGASGRAITFACPDQHRDVRDIERLLKAELPLSPHSRLSLAVKSPVQQARQRPSAGSFRSNGRNRSARFR
jgi:ATP-dependent RNA helicase RhlE